MRKSLSYLFVLVISFCLAGCYEVLIEPAPAKESVDVRLVLNMPGDDNMPVTRVSGTDTEQGDLDYTTEEQRYIRDIKVLIVQNGRIIQIVSELEIQGQQGAPVRIIKLTAQATADPVDAMVIINARDNGISDETIQSLLGKTLDEVHDVLIFQYPSQNGVPSVWNLTQRYLPMWGMTKGLDLSRVDTYGSCDVYRSVAKMAFQVDEDCTGFTMKEIYLYNMETKGYVMSEHEPNAAIDKQYTLPDVPSSSVQTNVGNAVRYDVTDNSIINRVFLPESDNKSPENGKPQLKVVVGGIWNGEGLAQTGGLNYWRIDMSDEFDNPYDIIRNHSYVYNIRKVENPGTPTPDEALDHAVAKLKVELEEWTPQYMRGVPDQYTLTTSKSVITLDNYMDTAEHSFDVWTDYGEGWTIETDAEGNIIDSSSGEDKPIDWLEINTVNGPYNQTVTVKVNAENINLGGTLTNRFWIKAGNIRKEITVIFPQPPTANCYVVGDSAKDGEYSIIVGIKGNGADGTRPEGVDIALGASADMSPVEDATLVPSTLGIIWETKAGLISLKHPVTGVFSTGRTRVPYDPETNSLDFKTNLNGASIGGKKGGNALVGAFDKNGVVIWSWHIWVCPEMYNASTGQIKENEFLENWTASGYQFLDRNLGALAATPDFAVVNGKWTGSSVATMGLQYQWGRKDPFIGPAYSNDRFLGNGLIPVVHYYEAWGVNGRSVPQPLSSANRNIDYTVAHPTQLVYWNHSSDGEPTALVSLNEIGGYLWGTDQGMSSTVKELGTKTIYDPCPVGYRVPPVDAFIFKTPYPKGYSSKRVLTESWDSEKDQLHTVNVDMLALSSMMEKNSVSNYYGKEHVFIHWFHYDGTKDVADSPPLYYRRLTADNNVIPPGATKFRIACATETGDMVSSFTSNFGWNLVNIPFNIPYVANGDTYTRRLEYSPNHIFCLIGPYEGSYYKSINNLSAAEIKNPKKYMLGGACFYGFYMNYNEMDEPKMQGGNHYFLLDSKNPDTITWLPLTGAYDPTQGITFKYGDIYKDDNGNDVQFTIRVEAGSSITVNSFLWTNSSVLKESSAYYPAGIALHGAEPRGQYNTYYGRHIHGLTHTNVQADRHYTAAVRCIKDVKKVKWDNINLLTDYITVSSGGSATITLRSVNGSWKLVDPGAPWLLVTPDKGEANGGDANNNITLKVKAGTAAGSTTTISFQLEGENTVRKCRVRVTN